MSGLDQLPRPLAVLGTGACCPVGLNTAQVASSLRAGVSRKTETGFVDAELEPLVIGHLAEEHLPPWAGARGGRAILRRLVRLAAPAYCEALASVPGLDPARVPVFVAGPQGCAPEGEEAPSYLPPNFLAHLAHQSGQPLPVDASSHFATGQAGFFVALLAAAAALEAGRCELALVGGVDSYLDAARLRQLEAEGRLQTRGPQDSFTPGEGASFLLLGSRSICASFGLAPRAWIHSVGLGREPGHRYSETHHHCQGLSAALGGALEALSADHPPVSLVLAGLTGEALAAKEWGVAFVRNREHFDAAGPRIDHDAEYIGDAGAALVPLMLTNAIHHLHRRLEHYPRGPALAWGASDLGERGALVFSPA